jgi:hypothetical protein
MPDPILDEINLTTLKEIYPRVIRDNFFLDTPFLAYMRAQSLVPFGGGSEMHNTFLYAPMIGGFYKKGQNFNITKRPTLAGTKFVPKYIYVSVPEYKEDIQVINKGPLAVFSLIDTDLKNAMNTITAKVAVSLMNHGQAAGTGVAVDRSEYINGIIEAMNDGLTEGWTGDYFPTYGTATRNGVVGTALNSEPLWVGKADGTTGPITFPVLEESYQSCTVGKEEPNIGVGNKHVISLIKEILTPMQRFAQEKDPVFGVHSFRFNNAMILKDDYFPSARYGVNDAELGNYKVADFTSANTTKGANSNLPVNTLIKAGEVFCWFNTSTWLMRISDDEEYGFGFSGFVPAQDNTRVVGQIKAAINLECTAPRLNKQLFGIA